jgi:hypothetical protein
MIDIETPLAQRLLIQPGEQTVEEEAFDEGLAVSHSDLVEVVGEVILDPGSKSGGFYSP